MTNSRSNHIPVSLPSSLSSCVFVGWARTWPGWQMEEGLTQVNTSAWASWRCRLHRTGLWHRAGRASPYAPSLCTQWEAARRKGAAPRYVNNPRLNLNETPTPNSAPRLRPSTPPSAQARKPGRWIVVGKKPYNTYSMKTDTVMYQVWLCACIAKSQSDFP